MARIRSIKPEFWTSEQIMECSMNARLLFVGMWNFADDLGRLPLSPKTIKAQILPNDEVSGERILGMIQELSNNGLLLIYTVAGKDYLQITGWQHQRIDKPQPGKYPAPVTGYSKVVPGVVATDRKGEEGKVGDTNSEANASGAEAPVDHRKRLFDEGLPRLAAMTGKGPDACRSFVGKCLKAASDDAITVLGLIEDAERNRVVDPTAWIVARIKPATGPPASARPLTEFQRKQQATINVTDKLKQSALAERSGGTTDWLLSNDHSERSGDLRGGPSSPVLAISGAPDRGGR